MSSWSPQGAGRDDLEELAASQERESILAYLQQSESIATEKYYGNSPSHSQQSQHVFSQFEGTEGASQFPTPARDSQLVLDGLLDAGKRNSETAQMGFPWPEK